MPRAFQLHIIILAGIIIAPGAAAQTGPKAYGESIDKVTKEIKTITKELNKNKALLKSERDSLLEIEQSMHTLTLELEQTEVNLARHQHENDALVLQQKTLLKSQEKGRQALKNLLESRYQHGKADHINTILNQKNPYAVGRLRNYQRYFSGAMREQYQHLAEKSKELADLKVKQEEAIIALKREQAEKKKINENQKLIKEKRAKSIAKLDKRIASNTEKLESLKRDRRRLNSLLKKLKKQAEELARIEKARAEQKAREEEQRKREQATKPQPQSAPARVLVKGGFKKQKGRLAYPVIAKPARKFGARLPESGMLSEGHFFATKGSVPVKSIFRGRVLFADFLKGYGLLIIVDHGDDHISLYGHNHRLLKKVGDPIDTNEVIAQTGVTGGLKSHGLYFEIRNNATPVDPSKWCR